jgi:hypothetical protein
MMKENEFRLKSVLMSAGLAATLLLAAGCTREEALNPAASGTEGNVVRLSITRAGATTRAVNGVDASAPVDDGEALTIATGGYIVFTDNAGKITKVVTILPEGIDYTGTDDDEKAEVKNITEVKFIDIDATAVHQGTWGIIKEVPASSTHVYIYMNLPEDLKTTVFGNPASLVQKDFVTAVGAKYITAVDLADPSTFGVAKVPVRGDADLVTDPDGGLDYTLRADVELRAVASRIEINSIKLKIPAGAIEVDYTLEVGGITINNFYNLAKLDNTYPDIVNHGVDATLYREEHSYFYYNKPANYALYLYTSNGIEEDPTSEYDGKKATPIGFSDVVNASAGKFQTLYPKAKAELTIDKPEVWGFNVFPNDLVGINDEAGYLPHVVIRVNKLTYTYKPVNPDYDPGVNDPQANPSHLEAVSGEKTNQWLTVRGYNATSGLAVENFQRGYSYKIGGLTGLEFSPEDLADLPEGKTVSAMITATVFGWKTENITPVY